MKTTIIALAALLSAHTAAHADGYKYLSFEKSNGDIMSVDVASLQMTFDGGRLLIANDAGTYELSTADITRMFFADAPQTGISDASATDDGKVQVYTASGVYVGTFDSEKSFAARSSHGVYIVKQNGRTLKTTVK